MPHPTRLVACLGAERNYKTYIFSKNRNPQRLILVAFFMLAHTGHCFLPSATSLSSCNEAQFFCIFVFYKIEKNQFLSHNSRLAEEICDKYYERVVRIKRFCIFDHYESD